MEKRVKAFIKLREFLSDFLNERKTDSYRNKFDELDKAIDESHSYNGWFTKEYILKALQGIELMLEETQLKQFAKEIKEPKTPKTVAVIMAGNIPAVGFHDFMCVLLSGNKILLKPSSDDKILITFFAEFLMEVEPLFKERILFTDGRMSAEVFRILTVDNVLSKAYYPTTLFTEAEAFGGSCTAKSTIYCASIAAGQMISNFTKWLREFPCEKDILYNILTCEVDVK